MAAAPNVLLWTTHDTGRFVGPYGYQTVATPACDRLAAEGVVAEQYFATCPLCSPSRAAICSGLYPHQTGVLGLTSDHLGGWDFAPTVTHAARHFGQAGYESVLCGFEHEVREWQRVGFEHSLNGRGGWFNGGGDLRDAPGELDAWLAARDPARPFYLQLGCHETHRDWAANDTPPDDSRGLWQPPYLHDLPAVRQEVAALQGAVRRLDEQLGRVLAVLRARGVLDQTVVAFTTDHGVDFPRAKGTFYDPGLETLLLLRWPGGGWTGGRRLPQLLSNVDLLPTLLEAAGLPRPAELAGRSFLPLLQGAATGGREAVFAEKTYHDSYDPTRCLRTSRWKYLRHFEVNIFQDLRLATMTNRHYWRTPWLRRGVEELYDLSADPGEEQNLATDPAHAATLATLRRQLRDWMRETADPLLQGMVPNPYYSAQLREFLAAP
ncbi:MAG: sulfatase [Fimbriimonadaceae bacterium]|nr:sulfatase [Fimbriimonadaceae bacterium]